jgi:hypothetical protein
MTCHSTSRSSSRPRHKRQENQSRRRHGRRKPMRRAQNREIGTSERSGWTSKVAGERMWKMTTPAVIRTLQPTSPSIGHHLDRRSPHTSLLQVPSRSRNLREETPQGEKKKMRRKTNGMVFMGVPETTLSVHKGLVYLVERVLLGHIGNL